MKVAFYTLGCKVNQYDTNAMAELFSNAGFEVINFNEIADVYVINTCTVTNTADKKSKNIIRRAYSKNNNAIICVCGCLAQRDADKISKMPEVSVVVGTQDRSNIVNIVMENSDNKNFVVSFKDEYEELTVSTSGDLTTGYIKIQEGCNNFCSYCIIPYVRGRVRSRSLNSIVKEANALANSGVKEIMLTGIHISSYGTDNNSTFMDVIRNINEIDGIIRIHLGSLEPHILTGDFLKELKKCNKVCEHFHVSLQSGSDEILKKMNRKYTSQEYLGYINNIRNVYPQCAVTTDVIAGFPTESEEDFLQSCEFVKKVKFARIHVFPYSMREGTKAAQMPQISEKIKKLRALTLIDIGKLLEKEYMQSFLEKIQNVLFYKSVSNDYFEGYSDKYLRVWAKGVNINESYNIKLMEIYKDLIIGEKV